MTKCALLVRSFSQYTVMYNGLATFSHVCMLDNVLLVQVEEYTREQIPFDRHDFPDNQPCLDLIEKRPMGLLPLMDSECLRGAVASDQVCTISKVIHHSAACIGSTALTVASHGKVLIVL
jgi:Myosin head (motor domain)